MNAMRLFAQSLQAARDAVRAVIEVSSQGVIQLSHSDTSQHTHILR
jgi:hypothetical protein